MDILIFLLCLLVIYLVPTFIAFARGHDYRWVILALNILGGWTIVMWGVALVWSVFPRGRMLVDPLVGSATGFRDRNVGDLIGEAEFGRRRGYGALQEPQAPISPPHSSTVDMLERLQRLRDSGAITRDEFEAQKHEVLRAPKIRL
ncbi:MAG: superinfection immunity protein [Rhizobiales bacterium]|nr:superinfection immunity protein [Hyphomicrobiales bacterium]